MLSQLPHVEDSGISKTAATEKGYVTSFEADEDLSYFHVIKYFQDHSVLANNPKI